MPVARTHAARPAQAFTLFGGLCTAAGSDLSTVACDRARENLAQERQARVDAEALVAELQEQLTEALRKGEAGAAEAAKQKLQDLAPEKDAVMVGPAESAHWAQCAFIPVCCTH